MIRLLVFIMILIFKNYIAQEYNRDKIIISFHHSNDQTIDSLKKEVTVLFEGGFNDSIVVRYDGKIIMQDFLKTDFSTSFTEKTLNINYENMLKGGKFIIECKCIDVKPIIEVEIKEGYRIIEISKYDGYWYIIYSNTGPVFE